MARIELLGPIGPGLALRLDRQLDPLTERVRPLVTVDLCYVTELHPAAVSVLIRHQQRAARLGGDLVVLEPRAEGAQRVLEQIGLCRVAPGAFAA